MPLINFSPGGVIKSADVDSALGLRMKSRMPRPISQLKVFDAIVVRDLISMMDDLSAGEFATQRPFHNEPVLRNVFVADANPNVSVSVVNSPALPPRGVLPRPSDVWRQMDRRYSTHADARAISRRGLARTSVLPKLRAAHLAQPHWGIDGAHGPTRTPHAKGSIARRVTKARWFMVAPDFPGKWTAAMGASVIDHPNNLAHSALTDTGNYLCR
jgi:hypothetical protein